MSDSRHGPRSTESIESNVAIGPDPTGVLEDRLAEKEAGSLARGEVSAHSPPVRLAYRERTRVLGGTGSTAGRTTSGSALRAR